MPHYIARTPGTNCDHGKNPKTFQFQGNLLVEPQPICFGFVLQPKMFSNIRVEDVFGRPPKCGGEFGLETKTQLRSCEWTVKDQTQLKQWSPDSQLITDEQSLEQSPGGQVYRSSMKVLMCYFLLNLSGRYYCWNTVGRLCELGCVQLLSCTF